MYLQDLFEARAKNDSEIEYKEKSVKGVLDRVTAILTGNKSGSFTRLAQRYQRLDRLTKLMKMERDKLNAETKKRVSALFDAEDEILTRVVETASLAATLSKIQEQNNEYFDIDSYVEELEQLMPGLEDKIAALRAKYTTIEKIEKSEALRVRVKDPDEIKAKKKLKTKESLEEVISVGYQDKKYPDTEQGAIAALAAMSNLNLTRSAARPDPMVPGVWLVDYGRGKAIVYLGGYSVHHPHNDFEQIDEQINEAASDDLIAKLKEWSKKVLASVSNWANDFDDKILSIRSRMLKDGLVG